MPLHKLHIPSHTSACVCVCISNVSGVVRVVCVHHWIFVLCTISGSLSRILPSSLPLEILSPFPPYNTQSSIPIAKTKMKESRERWFDLVFLLPFFLFIGLW